MKAFIFFALLIISIAHANEQEEVLEHNNTRVSVYLHPVSFSLNLLDRTTIYSTIEIPFNLSNSLIIRPSLLGAKNGIFRLGSDIGFRHYLTGKGEGLYLQGQMGIFYYRRNIYTDPPFIYDDTDCDDVDCNEDDHELISSPLWLDIMGYIGYSLKFSWVSVFIDIGVGAIIGTTPLFGWPDVNISVGIPFGAPKSANAQEKLEPKQDNTRVSVYLHPFFFLLGFSEEANPALLIYSTIEIPFNLKQALIIKPSLAKLESKVKYPEDDEPLRQLRVGSDVGIRIYHDRKGEGSYWQIQTGAFYHDARYLFPVSANNSIWLDIMGYSGYSWKFSRVSVFTDIGIGLGGLYGNWYSRNLYGGLYALNCDGKCFGFFPIIDANFGIGIPF